MPPLLAALLAGAVAALVAVALSLPLESPDDVFLNSATVAVGVLIAAVALGAVWQRLPADGRRATRFWLACLGLFALVVVAALLANSQLARTASFSIPLAAVGIGLIALLTPVFATMRLPRPEVLAPLAAVVALGAGVALAGQGDQQSGRLSLPDAPRQASTAVAGTAIAGASGMAATGRGSTSAFSKPADVAGKNFVVGQGSQATFTVNEKLAQLPAPGDAVERTSDLQGEVHLDQRPTVITLNLQSLSSDQRMRDNFIRTNTFRNKPTATVTFDSVAGLLPQSYTLGQVVKTQATGRVKIGDTEAPLPFDLEARLDEGGVLNVHGTTQFNWADLGLTRPSTPTVQVQDTVRVEVLLIANMQ